MIQAIQEWIVANLNLRGVPMGLAKSLKSEAALAGISLRDYCVSILEDRGEFGHNGITDTIDRAILKTGDSKKIANMPEGGAAQEELSAMGLAKFAQKHNGEVRGIPEKALPPMGKAQVSIKDLQNMWGTVVAAAGEPDQAICVEPIGGWDICGTCGQVHTSGEYFNHKFVGRKFPEWSEERLREMAAAEDEALSATGGLLACSPEIYAEMEKSERVDGSAKIEGRNRDGNGGSGVYDTHAQSPGNHREGLSQTGNSEGGGSSSSVSGETLNMDALKDIYAEMEALHGQGGSAREIRENEENSERLGETERGVGSDSKKDGRTGIEFNSRSARSVDMQALKDICAGKIPNNIHCECGDEMCLRCNKCKGCEGCECSDPAEVELCGFKSFNDTDGEWYMCCKEKHPYPKVKHGEWVKV